MEQERLRNEVECMIQVYTETLQAHLGERLTGLLVKGSAIKPWDSPIDYVPGISDIDIQMECQGTPFESNAQAMAFAALAEDTYHAKNPNPLHTPQVQLRILESPGTDYFEPSPQGSTRVIIGENKCGVPEKTASEARARKELADSLEFLKNLPPKICYKTTEGLAGYRGHFSWQVSPLAPRVLFLRGMDYERVWSINRTTLVAELRKAGLQELSDAYSEFYTAGWDYFNKPDRAAITRCILAGESAIKLANAAVKQ